MRKIDNKIVKTNKYIIIKFVFYDKLNNIYVKKIVIIKIYIINDFAINLLLNNDVLCLKKNLYLN
jgi:hypothetical protein